MQPPQNINLFTDKWSVELVLSTKNQQQTKKIVNTIENTDKAWLGAFQKFSHARFWEIGCTVHAGITNLQKHWKAPIRFHPSLNCMACTGPMKKGWGREVENKEFWVCNASELYTVDEINFSTWISNEKTFTFFVLDMICTVLKVKDKFIIVILVMYKLNIRGVHMTYCSTRSTAVSKTMLEFRNTYCDMQRTNLYNSMPLFPI